MRQKKHLFFLLALILMVLPWIAPSPAYGQGYQGFASTMEQIAAQARWRIGPFHIAPSIGFSNIGYDNNVYQMRQEDEPIGDYTATISPSATAYLLFRNWLILSFSANPAYVYYLSEKNQRGFNTSYSPSLRIRFLGRFVLSGTYQYSRVRRRATSEFDRRVYVRTQGYSGRLFFETLRGTSIGITASFRKMRYEDLTIPGSERTFSSALDRKEKNAQVEFYYRIFSESSFFITAGYTEYEFGALESRWRDSHSYQAFTGIQFPLLGRARGRLSIGYRSLFLEAGESNAFSGLVGDTGLDFRLGRFGFRLLFVRDFRFSYSRVNAYFIEHRYGGGLSYYFSENIRADYNFVYGEGSYPDPVLIAGEEGPQELERRDIYRSHSAGIVFRIIKRTGIGLTFNFWERMSSFRGFNRSRTFIGGYVTYDF